MSNFSFEIPSSYTPEQIGNALVVPIPPSISEDMYHGLVVKYDGLDAEGHIQAGTQQSVDLGSGKFNMVRSMIPGFPESITVSVAELTDSSRQDVFDDDQVVSGVLNRSIREDGGAGILVVEGDLVIGSALAKHWPSFLGDLDQTAISYGVRQPNEVMLERLPEIIEHS